MKKLNLIFYFLIAVSVLASNIYAQQDYQIVQNYTNKYQKIEQSIKTATSLSQLDSIQTQIEQLRTENQDHEVLLNKSLYPDDFNSSLEKLDNALTVRKGDYSQITTLQTQVSGFKMEIDQLNKKNADLFNRIQTLQEETAKNKQTIASLGKTIAELRYSLHQRDRLVMTMLDSLLPPSVREHGRLTTNEKQNLYAKEKKSNVINNIKSAIDDNIKFLEMTNLTPNDLISIKKQEHDFQKLWQGVGPEIVDVYSSRKQNENELKNIDSKFTEWNSAIEQEAWTSLHHNFSVYGINLNKFSNGQSFISVTTSYIDDQIKNVNLNPDKAKETFNTFTDSVWFKTVKPDWIPYLTQNNMLSDSSEKIVESKIAQWKSIVEPGSFNWLYLIIAVLLIFIVVLLVKSGAARKKKAGEETA